MTRKLSFVLVALLVLSSASCRTESKDAGSPADSSAAASATPASAAEAYKDHQAFFEQEARERPDDPNSFYNLGNVYFMQGKYAEAAEQYRLALNKKIDDKNYEADLLTRLGNAHAALKQTDEAAAAYQKALAASPDSAEAKRRLADLYEQAGRAAEASRVDPNAAGRRLILASKLHDGVAALQKVEPKNAETHYLIGMGYFKLEKYAEAADALGRAVRLDPKYVDAQFNLGNAYARLNRHADAAKSFAEVVRLTPDAADAHYNLGNAYANLGRYDEAVAAYEQSLRINPDDATARLQLTQLHLRHGNAEAAARQHDELKRLNPQAAARLEEILRQGVK